MIALAGAIGTGLFLGSGKSIQRAGPVGTLIVCFFSMPPIFRCPALSGFARMGQDEKTDERND